MEGQTPPETITLPKSGGTVWFRDVEDISSTEYQDIRDMGIKLRRREVDFTSLSVLGMQTLITKWEIPGLPDLPTPGSEAGRQMKSETRPHWRDVRAIEEAMLSALTSLTLSTAEEELTKNSQTPPSDE